MISVLTLTYKRHFLLEEAIESFLRQDCEFPSEMVIINDNSEVEYRVNHPNVRIFNVKTRFPSIASKIEWGYKQCNFDYIYRLDDDDLLAPGGLNNACSDILNYPGYEIYRSKGMYFFSDNKFLKISDNINNGNIYKKSYLDRITFPDKSGDEDVDITFGNDAKIYQSEHAPTMIYRWGMGTLHISGMGKSTNEEVLKRADEVLSNIKGKVTLRPRFRFQHYDEIKKAPL